MSGLSVLRSDNNYSDGNGHGTHVAGTVAALDNTVGVVGVAPAAQLYAVKVLDNSGRGSASTVVAGIDWAVQQEIPILRYEPWIWESRADGSGGV